MQSTRSSRLSVIAVTSVLALSACSGGGNNTGPGNAAPTPSGSASPEMQPGEHGGTRKQGRLIIGEKLPPRDAPDHGPATILPQTVFKSGEKTVFAIEGRRQDDYKGFGTGFVVNKDEALGVTNAHVVQGLTALKGRFNNGETVSLRVLASDPCADLAVVNFTAALPENVEPVIIGSSSVVQPGDEVSVLGYPGSLTADTSKQKLLITNGLVNAVKVPAQPQGLPEYKDTIQHGATINHGNSGGPLIDHHGRVIGINTLTNQGAAENQFYSISIDSAVKELQEHLLKGESQNDLGWAVDELYSTYFEDLNKEVGPTLDARIRQSGIKGGLYVKAVTAGSGAAKAGIKPGMLITRMQDTSVRSLSESCDIIGSIGPGQVIGVEGVYLLSNMQQLTTKFRAEFSTPGKR